jgi:hypothetical protein
MSPLSSGLCAECGRLHPKFRPEDPRPKMDRIMEEDRRRLAIRDKDTYGMYVGSPTIKRESL